MANKGSFKSIDSRRGPGGAKPGAGRKPAAATKLKESIADYAYAAVDALKMCIEFANDPMCEKSLRLAAGKEVMDRVWGKPVQKQEHSGEIAGRIVLVRAERD